MKKKLSVAFLWHMHQPVYQDTYEGIFYMPWVRMHAVKDYLDMLHKIDKFPNLKLNFNLSPTVLDAFRKYSQGYHDIHSSLTVKATKDLTDEDKRFILNYFFDANYSMIMRYNGYNELYKKRKAMPEVDIEAFSDQEYSDIMFWFNLAWTDPIWIKKSKELKSLIKKGGNYTQDDRIFIINYQRDLIKKIIPDYKKYQDKGKIEITTNPLYHPILPLLIDKNIANNTTSYGLPNYNTDFKSDARAQIKTAITLYEQLFGKTPKGMWPSELSVSKDALEMFSEYGIKWTIADESILSDSIEEDFVRDNRGNLEDPYHLSKVYTYNKIGLYFRNAVFANLIGFEYSKYGSLQAANDLYDRLKLIQDKLQSSPDQNHIVVIAMDGENSWENYTDDGNEFLETLYSLITNDESLETVTLSEYYENNKEKKLLNNISSGSWLDKNFQLWICEPTKNKAWEYISRVRQDLIEFDKNTENEELRRNMWHELYVAEGSDWFWWFGEPNDSGQDNLFDYLFRKHLQNIYILAKKPIPDFLKKPLIMIVNSPSRYQKTQINPIINGNGDSEEWNNAGCIDIPSGPLSDNNQILTRICYGVGSEKLYLRMDLNKYTFDRIINAGLFYQIYIYLKNRTLSKSAEGKLRLVMRPESLTPILKESFSHEIKFTFASAREFPPEVAYSNKEGLWFSTLNNKIKYILGNVLEIEIPLDDIGLNPSDIADFIVVDGYLGHGSGTYPRDMFLTVERAKTSQLVTN